METVVLDPALTAWFREAHHVPGLLPSGFSSLSDWPHTWFWDGHEHVDPQKEANAQATRLASHTTTLAEEYARKGQDWEVQLRQRAKELTLMNELGLASGSLPTATTPEETDADDDDDENPARAA